MEKQARGNNMAEKIIGVYKITNTVTGDFYIGSSKNIKNRWACHKCQSTWKNYPNNQMYLDMQKYSVDKFELQILKENTKKLINVKNTRKNIKKNIKISFVVIMVKHLH